MKSIVASDLISQVSIDRYKSLQPNEIVFTEKEMSVTPKEGKQNTVPVEYKEVSGTVWGFSLDNGKTWNEVRIQDANTLIRIEKKEETDTEIVYTLTRKQ
ncbi:MAG: hypothetical protein K5657_08015 [Desulfovibrio sp.]|nr:hypothetical protein [Desulfovibrio sp.]